MNKAKPISRLEIINKANEVRNAIKIKLDEYFPIELFEIFLEAMDYKMIILKDQDMEEEAVTIPELKIVKIKESVYNGLIEGNPRDRFTAGHELGHIILRHNKTTVQFARSFEEVKAYENPEWQANEFAACLLAPLSECKNRSLEDISSRFGCSLDVASKQKKKLATSGLK